jgi:hypothetical protein
MLIQTATKSRTHKMELPHPGGRGGRLDSAAKWAIRGCAQCAHPGLRIGPYIGRTGSYWLCFREFPVFARAGVRFESHLGHVFSLFRGFWAPERAQAVHMWALFGGLFCWWPSLWPASPSTRNLLAWLLVTSSFVVHGVGDMTGSGCERLRYVAVAFPVGLHDLVRICSRPAWRPRGSWHARGPRRRSFCVLLSRGHRPRPLSGLLLSRPAG